MARSLLAKLLLASPLRTPHGLLGGADRRRLMLSGGCDSRVGRVVEGLGHVVVPSLDQDGIAALDGQFPLRVEGRLLLWREKRYLGGRSRSFWCHARALRDARLRRVGRV